MDKKENVCNNRCSHSWPSNQSQSVYCTYMYVFPVSYIRVPVQSDAPRTYTVNKHSMSAFCSVHVSKTIISGCFFSSSFILPTVQALFFTDTVPCVVKLLSTLNKTTTDKNRERERERSLPQSDR